MDICHIAQVLHLVSPQGVRRRDVIDWISSHIYIASTFKHTLASDTTAIIHTGSTHILTTVFHTSEYKFRGVPTHVHFSRWPRPCSFQSKQLLNIGATFDDFS